MNRYKKKSILILVLILSINNQKSLSAYPNDMLFEFQIQHAFKEVKGTSTPKIIPKLNNYLIHSDNAWSLNQPLNLEFPVINLNTRNSNRDSHMIETLHFPEYKYITVIISSIQANTVPNQYTVEGNIKITNIQRPFRSSANINNNIVSGSLILKLSDYNIQPPKLLFMEINNEVKISYQVKLPNK